MATNAITFNGVIFPNPVTNLRIIHQPDGRPARRDFPGSGATSVVSAASFRYRREHCLTGNTERLLDQVDEVSADTIESRPQPFTIVGDIDGQTIRSVPDRARLLRSGVRQLAECKASWDGFFKPSAFRQSLLAKAAADALGWDYVQIVPSVLGSRQYLANVDRIYGCRGVRVPDTTALRAVQLLAEGPMKLGDFTARIHDREVNGFSMACAMMVRRIVDIELERPLGQGSLVRIMPATPRGLPSISFRRGRI